MPDLLPPANRYYTVPPEQAAAYGAIIDLILQKSDLNSISAKQVRKELSERLGYDITAQKVHTPP